MREGWPAQVCTDEQFQPYVRRKDELSTEGGCVLWGNRVVLPLGEEKGIGSATLVASRNCSDEVTR